MTDNIFFIDSSGKAWTLQEWKEQKLVYQYQKKDE